MNRTILYLQKGMVGESNFQPNYGRMGPQNPIPITKAPIS